MADSADSTHPFVYPYGFIVFWLNLEFIDALTFCQDSDMDVMNLQFYGFNVKWRKNKKDSHNIQIRIQCTRKQKRRQKLPCRHLKRRQGRIPYHYKKDIDHMLNAKNAELFKKSSGDTGDRCIIKRRTTTMNQMLWEKEATLYESARTSTVEQSLHE